MEERILIFAYGSLLDPGLMNEICPQARVVVRGRLHGYRVGFPVHSERRGGGISSILAAPGGIVRGVVYDIARAELERLDAFEGVPVNFYRRVTRAVAGDDGRQYDAELYEAVAARAECPPAHSYVTDMLRGARAHNLEDEYVRWLESLTG